MLNFLVPFKPPFNLFENKSFYNWFSYFALRAGLTVAKSKVEV